MPSHATTAQHSEREGGYTAAASWLAKDPDNETFVFRKFDKLAALNLLCLQSELLDLEKQLDEMHIMTVESYELDVKDAASTWETLISQAAQGQAPGARERMKLIFKIRMKLKEYHEALLLQSNIAQLHRPDNRVLEAVRHFFSGPLFPILGGKAKTFLDDVNDLVAIKTSENMDHLSRLVRQRWGKAESAADGTKSSYARFNEGSIVLLVNIITVVVAAVFLVGSIFALYNITNPLSKLLAITGFMCGFAASIGLITNARRVEIFAATAAYAAVLVVFVSNESLSPRMSE